MTTSDLTALVRGFAPAVRDFVVGMQRSLVERIATLEAREAVPGPQGPTGKDGRDGVLDADAGIEQIDERSWRFVRGDGTPLRGVFKNAAVLDRGVYQAGRLYEKGDGVTFGGSFWIAQDGTSEKPGDGATKWRLAVKAGREGREGKQGPQGPQGPAGSPGMHGRDYR